MGCIVAIVNLDGTRVDERLLRTMMDVAPYRRPLDQQSTLDDCVGLGFVPLRSGAAHSDGKQPFGLFGRLCGVLDGRLDDRSTLVRRLETSIDRDLTSAADVELILRAYDVWGQDCVQHLIGDFAFCIWDRQRRQVFCARDHFGVKPLYYARVGQMLVLGNVLHSVRQYPAVSGRLSDEAIGDLLLFGLCQDPSATLFAGISKLPPAHRLTCAVPSGQLVVDRYWTLEPRDPIRYKDSREYVDHFAQELKTAVHDRLRNDRASVFMSGGLDSSSVAAMATEVLGPSAATALRAYTVVYSRLMDDRERHYSAIVAKALNIQIEHVPVDDYDLFDRWDSDALPPEPTAEPLSAIMADLFDRAAEHSSVVMTGDGGDPLLLPSAVTSQIGRLPLSWLTHDVWQCIRRLHKLPPLGLRSGVRKWFQSDTAEIPGWLAPSLHRHCDIHARWTRFRRSESPRAVVRGTALQCLLAPLWPATFESQDPGATRRPVEVRYPYFDLRLTSFALGLPSSPWCVNKEIVRSAMRGRLPDVIRLRPKSPLAANPVAVRRRWTIEDAMRSFAATPVIDRWVDRAKFRTMVRPEHLLMDEEPGTLAAIGLATWLRWSPDARAAQ